MKLASETKLGKVNNHVSRLGQNVVPLSHEEVMAVKTAFVKALASGGVGTDEVATDPAVARDQYARFVTKGRKTSYAALTPAERTKANIAMLITTKGAGTVLYDDRPANQVLNVQRPADKYTQAYFAIPQPFRLRLNTVPGLVADLK